MEFWTKIRQIIVITVPDPISATNKFVFGFAINSCNDRTWTTYRNWLKTRLNNVFSLYWPFFRIIKMVFKIFVAFLHNIFLRLSWICLNIFRQENHAFLKTFTILIISFSLKKMVLKKHLECTFIEFNGSKTSATGSATKIKHTSKSRLIVKR